MKTLSSCLLLTAISAAMFSTIGIAADSLVVQSMSELAIPPVDTLDAERVRIWLPVERSGACLVKVKIVDSLNQTIRSLASQLLSGGYYNFYWNKRDDYGRFVEPGRYKYLVDDCGKSREGWLEARFHRWELASRIDLVDSISDKVWLELENDSALVSITISSRRGRPIVQSVTDSLMAPGRHELQWIPEKSGYTGVYQMIVNVGGHIYPPIEIRASKK